jgi:toxin ParE1/3/4
MPKYELTEQAEYDVEEITDYSLMEWGKQQTISYLDGFEKLSLKLAHTPRMGTICNFPYEKLLSFPYKKHMIYYLPSDDGIIIIRVLHEKMKASLHL